ncbi:PIN2/TERF1-interacting telomerase inhibitor 1-like [Trichogramma pretiosum]|uniref:PIN2/TERF1-interacting telomerase inhibitor 1-like n=1 Tax=Trichogramma pretiosum TaxID=7493 RepID=UPI0006C97744|nr:PIN2/TERF1-interacting telomerase inhibitor 1-like [Trichogramma pretiosum]
MSMLAAPRQKQKWTLNPQGKQWSKDSSKLGQRMLEKMGWSSGKGLGAHEQGMTEHIRVKVKNDQVGLGHEKNKDDQWTVHQDSFNDLLANLQKEQGSTEISDQVLSGTSLEEKSKSSSKRVHYKKFTKGKDVNKYSAKDLANIFGKKELNEIQKESKAEENDSVYDPIGAKDTTAGIITIKGGDMSSYFQQKLNPMLNKINAQPEDSESETEMRAGFGSTPKNKHNFEYDSVKVKKESSCEKYIGFGFVQSSNNKISTKKVNSKGPEISNSSLVKTDSETIKDTKSTETIMSRKRKSEVESESAKKKIHKKKKSKKIREL